MHILAIVFKIIPRNCVFIVAIFLQLTGSILVSQENLKSNFEIAKSAFEELKLALKKDSGELWNYSLKGPVMLADQETRTVIANEKDPLGEMAAKDGLFVGKLADRINVGNTTLNWNGKNWAMVMYPLPRTKEQRLNLLIHECFHRIQSYIGFDSIPELQNKHLNTKKGRIYLKLEMEALKRALNSDHPIKHIKNALLFRLYRHQLFQGARKLENSLEINEGLAEYTGSILSQRSDSFLRQHYIAQIEKLYDYPTFVRSFAYVTIPVYGYFMQKRDEKWNLKIDQNTNLTDFIGDFYNISVDKLTFEMLEDIGQSYGIDSIMKVENKKVNYQDEQAKIFIEKFLADSIISLPLSMRSLQIAFNPANVIPLDSFGTIYPTLRLTDYWGILEVDSCGALINQNWTKVRVTHPLLITDTLIRGEGWKLKLEKSWKLQPEDGGYTAVER